MLPIFPEHVLDNSLHTAILVGLIVTWGMFELFGWVFAGFVVSGYLAALAMVSPTTLAVVLVEAVLCYGLVWILATGLSAAGAYSRVFGRERFMLFVLAAIPIRLAVTGTAMPRLESWLITWGWEPEQLGLGLFAIGVVLVPLTANTFYKTGLSRGLVQLSVNATLTWLVVSQVLARLTNFGFGDLTHTFDAMAINASESSRVVLVLVCTVFIAAHNNLKYGWDFGGILVPGMLAMLIFTPMKMLATVAEMVILFYVYRAVMRTRFVASLDLEGPRRIVSIYAVAWAWKFSIAWIVGLLDLRVSVSDLYGFGYLLTSLVVSRCLKQGGVVRTLVPLLATSFQGIALAVPLAAALAWWPHPEDAQDAPREAPAQIAAAVPALASASDASAIDALGGWSPWGAAGPTDAHVITLQREGGTACTMPTRGAVHGEDALVQIDCGGDGPVLVVSAPLGDPDSAWIVGWMAMHGRPSTVLLARVDPSRHPTRQTKAPDIERAVVRAAIAVAGARPILVVRTQERATGTRLHLRDASDVNTLVSGLGLSLVTLDTGPLPEGADAIWSELRPSDGVIVTSRDLVPAGAPATVLTLDDAVDAPVTAAPIEPDLLVDTVLPAVVRALEAGATGPSPAWLHHLAALVGAEVRDSVDPATGAPLWVLVRRADGADAVDRWLFRPGGAPWLVATGAAWRWPGMEDVALHHALALRARVTWIGAYPPHAQVRVRLLGDPRRAFLDRMMRAMLRPTQGWRAEGLTAPPTRLLLLETAASDGGPVRLSRGDEGNASDVDAPLDATVLDAFAPWPGTRDVVPGSLEASWQPTLPYAVNYATSMNPNGVVIAWYPTDLLRETPRAPERAARLGWYQAHRVPVAPGQDPKSTPGNGALCDQALAHANSPTDLSLAAARAGGVQITVLATPLRLGVLATRGVDHCAAWAAETAPVSP